MENHTTFLDGKTLYAKDLNPVQRNLYILCNPNEKFNAPTP